LLDRLGMLLSGAPIGAITGARGGDIRERMFGFD
jgi:hypothetical protein